MPFINSNKNYEVFKPSFVLTRSGIPEVVVNSFQSICIEGRHTDEDDFVLVTRSLFKPWQALAAEINTDINESILAVASHSGQKIHTDSLARLSEVLGINFDQILCPSCFPMDADVSATLKFEKRSSSKIFHPCAGKHLSIASSCLKRGESLEYCDENHPYHERLVSLLNNWEVKDFQWAKDSCGLPTLVISAKVFMSMWGKLGTDQAKEIKNLRDLWLKNPLLTGGQGRLDTAIMEACPGLLAKEGADGLLIIQNVPEVTSEKSATCLVKVASGYNSAYLAASMSSLLTKNSKILPPSLLDCASFLQSRLKNIMPSDQHLQFI